MIDSSRRMNMMDEKQKDTHFTERNTWYALRTFHRLELKVSLFLEENHLQHFIPMVYSTKMAKPKEDGEEVTLLTKMDDEAISELIILITGKDECGLTLMKGKIKKEDINVMMTDDKIMIDGRE